ncbi:MAG: cell division protein SepF [Candidatus Nanoarchaeia archaeon]|nr:cell division protein SepF [Candidatus Nanoarchaeia archaeon]MDD5587946.1 cell division protein SepF [Candidatus Nanoarchaeia archaeon]
MASIFSKIKERFGSSSDVPYEFGDYVEIDAAKQPSSKSKIVIRPFFIEDFPDIKPVLDTLREGYTVALVNIRTLKDKDLVELKRAVSKLKKTCDAIEGDIAGFGEDWIVATPNFAKVYRAAEPAEDVGAAPKPQLDPY